MSPVDVSPFIARVLENFDSPPQRARTVQSDRRQLSRTFFRDRVLGSGEPLLVRNGLSPKALRSWSPESVKAFLAREPRRFWVTRGVADQGDSRFEEISAGEYARYLFDEKTRTNEAEPIYLSISKEFMRILPDMLRELELDSVIPRAYARYPYAFLGPGKTVSGLHVDDYHSLFSQLWGHKVFLLFPPGDTSGIYLSKKYDWASKLSRIDLRQVASNRKTYPLLRGCTPFMAEVSSGDLLWIPAGWFHFVYATLPSFSVTVFLASPWRWLSHGIWEDWLKFGLHELGLVGRTHGCTCHGSAGSPDSDDQPSLDLHGRPPEQ